MSIFAQWSAGTDTRNPDAMIACLHPEFVFVRHQTGTTMNHEEMAQMLQAFMASDSVVVHSQRCIYENDEVMVEHSVMDFADGSREAVLSCHRLKDGRIVRTETGATPLDLSNSD